MFQGMGASSRTPLVPPSTTSPLHQEDRAPPSEQSGRAPPRSAPFTSPRDSAPQAPRPPPRFEVPPQPSTSGWVPPGPPPPRSRRDSSASESEANDGDSVASFRDSTTARLADLIYEVCPESRPLYDVRAPRCGFEAWFGQPEATASMQRFRMYPRVAEVQVEVAARSEALARCAKPLSHVIPSRARSYALADDSVFASSQPQFVAKSESLTRSIPRSFLVKSLADFAAGFDNDLLLCPVRALRFYLHRTRSLSPLRHRLFVSPRRPSRAMSKNAVSFLSNKYVT